MTTRSRSSFIVVLLGIVASTVTHGKDAFRSMPLLTADVRFAQQGSKLIGSDATDNALEGSSVALSADGNTAIVGAFGGVGAAWVWTRSAGVWTQQGPKLVGSGAGGPAFQGFSVSLSADGNTAIIGGPEDDAGVGAVWVWTRSGGVWTQQGPKLIGSGAVGHAFQGSSVSLSADGNTAIVGGAEDDARVGAVWVWTRSGDVWNEQGPKLVGSGAEGNAAQGVSVSLSADGNTAIVGGLRDNFDVGAVWVWMRSGNVWTQQGPKLVGSGAEGIAAQGVSVCVSADGNTAIAGGYFDHFDTGAAWVWTRSGGVWTQQGPKLVGTGAIGSDVFQGSSVALSADGNTAMIGGMGDNGAFFSGVGAAWVWSRSGGLWTQQGSKLVGSDVVGFAEQGGAVSLSADGNTAIVGGPFDNGDIGAAWVFVAGSPFTDDPLVAGVTVIKAQHVLELRDRIDTQRARFGLGAYSWSNPTLTAQTTVIKVAHLTEMRTALGEAYTAYNLPPPSYTDPGLAAGTVVKAVHITELRNAMIALEGS